MNTAADTSKQESELSEGQLCAATPPKLSSLLSSFADTQAVKYVTQWCKNMTWQAQTGHYLTYVTQCSKFG